MDGTDHAFGLPTKPIGSFYTKEEAQEIQKGKGYTFMEDAGRGYRRVVPSPLPKRIIELSAIRKMIQSGLIVIAVGAAVFRWWKRKTGFVGLMP